MKLLVSPERDGFPAPGPPPPPHGAKGPSRKEKERGERGGAPGKTKKKASAREPLPIVGKEVEVEGKEDMLDVELLRGRGRVSLERDSDCFRIKCGFYCRFCV